MLIAWATSVTVIIGAGALLRGTRLQSEFLSEADATSWARTTTRAFLQVFDRLYYGTVVEGTGMPFEKALWVGVILAPAVVFVLRVGSWVVGKSEPNKLDLLLIAVGIAFLYALVFWLWSMLPRRLRAIDIVPAILFVITPLVSLPAVFIAMGFVESVSVWRLVFIAVAVSYVNGLVWLVAVFVVPFRESDGLRQFPIHLGKVIILSGFFMAIVGLIQPDATRSFFDVVETDGLIALGFVPYSLFANGISLIETRWVLERGASVGVWPLMGLLALDLMLSAVIFVLPTTMWELPTFWDAIVFRGDRPWLGILFWTTFSTSAIFYAFVVAALLARPLASVVRRVGVHLDLGSQPIVVITIAMAVIVTLAFLVGAGAPALLTAVL